MAGRGTWRILASAAASAILAGCAVGPDFHRPAFAGPEDYLPTGAPEATVPADGVSQTFTPGLAPAAAWWTELRSQELNQLEVEGARNSPTLASADAALRQAEAQLRAGAGVFYPTVAASAAADREHGSAAAPGESKLLGTYSLYTLAIGVSYPVDLFGGERRTVEGLAAARDQSRYLDGAAALTLQSNIAVTAIAAAAYREEGRNISAMIAEQEEVRDLQRSRVQAGPDAYTQALADEAAVQSSRAELAAVQQKEAAAEDLLAILVGRSPGAAGGPGLEFVDFLPPDNLPLVLPSDLVRRRPDILAAEARLHAANVELL